MFDSQGFGEAHMTATSSNLRDVKPPKPVLILIDGHWWPGELDKWIREHDGWYGNCRELQ
jgi:hypothetical protein